MNNWRQSWVRWRDVARISIEPSANDRGA